jgi:hypothetical protein
VAARSILMAVILSPSRDLAAGDPLLVLLQDLFHPRHAALKPRRAALNPRPAARLASFPLANISRSHDSSAAAFDFGLVFAFDLSFDLAFAPFY